MAPGSVDPFLICPARQSWQLRQPPTDPQAAARLASELGLSPTMATILAGRGFSDAVTAEEFLQPGLEQLHSPFLFEAMEAAVERILSALQRGERIAVHGDYDVDGITGTVLLVTVLGHLGADVEFILPHRIDDGYGLNPSGIDKAHAAGARLLIAVDCGVTALAAAERATELGIDLIIADHHVPLTELPEAVAIINPRITGCGYPEGDLAAVGLAFKLARGVLQRHSGHASGISMLKLVALGTVADLVPLTGENRAMTWHGLRGLSRQPIPACERCSRSPGSRVAGLMRAMSRSVSGRESTLRADSGIRMMPPSCFLRAIRLVPRSWPIGCSASTASASKLRSTSLGRRSRCRWVRTIPLLLPRERVGIAA